VGQNPDESPRPNQGGGDENRVYVYGHKVVPEIMRIGRSGDAVKGVQLGQRMMLGGY
jgi:hypothetical protein